MSTNSLVHVILKSLKDCGIETSDMLAHCVVAMGPPSWPVRKMDFSTHCERSCILCRTIFVFAYCFNHQLLIVVHTTVNGRCDVRKTLDVQRSM